MNFPTGAQLLDWRLIFCFVITIVINALMTVTITLRIAGVETERIATSFSLFNLISLISRLANLLQAPVLGSLVDIASANGQVKVLQFQLHIIILGATVGTIIGFLLFNSSKEVFIKMIRRFEKTKSMPKLLIEGFLTLKGWKNIILSLRKPVLWWDKEAAASLMKPFVFYNIFVTAFWTTGVLSAMLASALVPQYARTATLLSGVVNGVATVLFSLAVDPQVAHITDQVVLKRRPKKHIYVLASMIGLGSILGTFLSQLILYPGAWVISFLATFIGKL